MAGCLSSNKKHACCCLPLNVVGLGYGVILLIMNLVSFVNQIKMVGQSDGSKGTQVASIIFTMLPILVAVFAILGVLMKKASLLRLAAKCIYAAILLEVVVIILVWVSISQSKNGNDDDLDPDSETVDKKLTTDFGVAMTVSFAIGILLLLYIQAVLKSIATMLTRDQNPWHIAKEATNEAVQRPTQEPETMMSDNNANASV